MQMRASVANRGRVDAIGSEPLERTRPSRCLSPYRSCFLIRKIGVVQCVAPRRDEQVTRVDLCRSDRRGVEDERPVVGVQIATWDLNLA